MRSEKLGNSSVSPRPGSWVSSHLSSDVCWRKVPRYHAIRCTNWTTWKPRPPQDSRTSRGQHAPHLLRLGDRVEDDEAVTLYAFGDTGYRSGWSNYGYGYSTSVLIQSKLSLGRFSISLLLCSFRTQKLIVSYWFEHLTTRLHRQEDFEERRRWKKKEERREKRGNIPWKR